MPAIRVNGAKLHYEDRGSGPQTIVFAHGLALNRHAFDAQVAALEDDYRCITFDFRGHGRSEVTGSGYDIGTLALDAAELIGRLGAAPVHFAGLSMGGFAGLRLAIRHPDLLRSLILIDAPADAELPANATRLRRIRSVTRWWGLWFVRDRAMAMLFGKTFRSDPGRARERNWWRKEMLRNDHLGVTRAIGGVLHRESVCERLGSLGIPTLVIVGEECGDEMLGASERLAQAIAGAELVRIPLAGHSPPIERPDEVNAAMRAFLSKQ